MEKLRKVVNEIAYTRVHTNSPALHRSLVPFLTIASSLYGVALQIRRSLYRYSLLQKHRLPVPVISVGNLSWGGNGKTPMVEYISQFLVDSGLTPLILTRGYAGGDEVKMLERHLRGGPVKIGVGANRAATAALFLDKYGCVDSSSLRSFFDLHERAQVWTISEKIGCIILDDGMQHWSLSRDLEIVMLNGLNPWGNGHLMPHGPLREPLLALERADVAVVHHVDLITKQSLRDIENMIQGFKKSIPIFYSKMVPKYLFDVKNARSHVALEALRCASVLCVSAIGSADAFVKSIEMTGAHYVDRLDFSDHHLFEAEDVETMSRRAKGLEHKSNCKPIIVVTEKDYDRDPEILKCLDSYTVLVLCSELQITPILETDVDSFNYTLMKALAAKFYVSS
ncbi:putative tetraacyldisaccharide 4'-kinase [Arabidopsis thaliana]|uniref:Probable tetraacyldisaccharide 4'-kinase, mitochondrial n=8 Tax=Arabidopsis TaxID=3701 RepID=LPXK_ARATH|nr:tetraacyldisaccharide 4'-kinase family protein [Arabidopsis thaliana]Q8LEA0.1 RecName: Full=Probable tetraacyldisaccharide 4'-kinase, mitochondrial; AltName: Full=Protein LIPID X 4'-kinase; Short=AtLpxK; Flags: Precursor [Arabidopsis thaliana]KAG7625963.1 Tetraacyldisaccharide 4'-kinase [Arabidopsis thaliana x Arabidopsis arenosa]KAG7631965.1 Tetraacyldisaccharide 4'-kinase [Arabidopsis suecica]AAM62765.1 unknown [Arabidopsis thaliana]AEE76385.1 tetraacyldisaccharide 4'-kinase family protei|eukprot:NP_566663.1 tetraacyldisaccharide 4'-kinase family protein [Arabidopsis thaliana]